MNSKEDMGEARRRAKEGSLLRNIKSKKKVAKNDSPRIIDWLPTTEKQRSQFIDFSITGGWVGIGVLVLIWLVVRIIGPAAGWWIPADVR